MSVATRMPISLPFWTLLVTGFTIILPNFYGFLQNYCLFLLTRPNMSASEPQGHYSSVHFLPGSRAESLRKLLLKNYEIYFQIKTYLPKPGGVKNIFSGPCPLMGRGLSLEGRLRSFSLVLTKGSPTGLKLNSPAGSGRLLSGTAAHV
ncbi:hypothetical protein [Neomoorella thermoacetica]|uniref:hypothetical protein n=1 Tax=Neomoorella thermoacetica TaxID=1525 RepID=UPI0030D0B0B5